MKTLVRTFLMLMIISLPLSLNAQTKTKNTTTVKFETSIECQNCVNNIMTNIPFEKGVKDVKCDLPTKTVTIEYNSSKTKPDMLRRAIEKLGYTAKEITEKSKS